MFMQNFIIFMELSAAVHELSCAQRKITLIKTILSIATANSNQVQNQKAKSQQSGQRER